jgi:hypothetical protein
LIFFVFVATSQTDYMNRRSQNSNAPEALFFVPGVSR